METALRSSPLRQRDPDHWIQAHAANGLPVFVAFNDGGISHVAPARDSAEFVMRHMERTGRFATPADPAEHWEIVNAVRAGDPSLSFTDLSDLSPFSRRVLEATAEIPRGETRTYQWMARQIGMPSAARAVNNALGANPIPLVVPCHRVVRGDGTIGEYALGSALKRALLSGEGLEIPAAA